MQTRNKRKFANSRAYNRDASVDSTASEASDQQSSETSDDPAIEGQKSIDKMSLKELFNRLTTPQLYAVVLALVGIVSGATWLGFSVKTFAAELDKIRLERTIIEYERKISDAERNLGKLQADLTLLQIQAANDKLELKVAHQREQEIFATSNLGSTVTINDLTAKATARAAKIAQLNAAIRREKARQRELQSALSKTKKEMKMQSEKQQAEAQPKASDKVVKNVPPGDPNKPEK